VSSEQDEPAKLLVAAQPAPTMVPGTIKPHDQLMMNAGLRDDF
jgi:hypothetical protein